MFPIVQGLASQAATPSTFQQDADREATNVTYAFVAIVFLVVAILLAITSIALGTMLCLQRKSVKSGPELTPHEGKCATPFNDYMEEYMLMQAYIHM